MTEVAKFDSVLHWKDVGDGVPARSLIVSIDESPPSDTPRITPNFLWRIARSSFTQRNEILVNSQQFNDLIIYFDIILSSSRLNLVRQPPTSALWLSRNAVVDARPQGVGATLMPPDLPLPTGASNVVNAALAPLIIKEGQPVPAAVIAAVDDLSPGATYGAAWNRTPTIRVSWTASSGERFVKDLAVSAAYVATGIARGLGYPLVLELDIPRNKPDGSVSQERFDLLQINGAVTIEALPVYWQDLQEGETLEGVFTPRKLFARRDDSQVENIEYDQTAEGATSISVQRVTAFACRQTQAPPLNAILSEFNIWDGSERTWQVQSVERLDRGRNARLQCVEYTGS